MKSRNHLFFDRAGKGHVLVYVTNLFASQPRSQGVWSYRPGRWDERPWERGCFQACLQRVTAMQMGFFEKICMAVGLEFIRSV